MSWDRIKRQPTIGRAPPTHVKNTQGLGWIDTSKEQNSHHVHGGTPDATNKPQPRPHGKWRFQDTQTRRHEHRRSNKHRGDANWAQIVDTASHSSCGTRNGSEIVGHQPPEKYSFLDREPLKKLPPGRGKTTQRSQAGSPQLLSSRRRLLDPHCSCRPCGWRVPPMVVPLSRVLAVLLVGLGLHVHGADALSGGVIWILAQA